MRPDPSSSKVLTNELGFGFQAASALPSATESFARKRRDWPPIEVNWPATKSEPRPSSFSARKPEIFGAGFHEASAAPVPAVETRARDERAWPPMSVKNPPTYRLDPSMASAWTSPAEPKLCGFGAQVASTVPPEPIFANP